MKNLLFILMLGSLFAEEIPEKSQIEQMTKLEKKQLYDNHAKSPILAGMLNLGVSLGVAQTNFVLFGGIPSIGHAYVESWSRGILSGIGLFGFSGVGLFSAPLGYAVFYSGFLLQAQDALYLAHQYNADLYNKIYSKENIKTTKKSIIQKMIDKKEAKKKAKTSNN